jgi:hypothetical protein
MRHFLSANVLHRAASASSLIVWTMLAISCSEGGSAGSIADVRERDLSLAQVSDTAVLGITSPLNSGHVAFIPGDLDYRELSVFTGEVSFLTDGSPFRIADTIRFIAFSELPDLLPDADEIFFRVYTLAEEIESATDEIGGSVDYFARVPLVPSYQFADEPVSGLSEDEWKQALLSRGALPVISHDVAFLLRAE